MTVTDTAPPTVSGWNMQTYQRLKRALGLGLRRQILVSVCDDFSLRDHFSERLTTELAAPSAESLSGVVNSGELITLQLNPSNPNFLAHIAQWITQHHHLERSLYTFQILGVELLTRQPADIQRSFLRCLQVIGRNFPRLEASLLIWLPRPWFYTIQESVPEFWQWHTGLFEFEGEPTSLTKISNLQPEATRRLETSLTEVEETPVAQEKVWQILTRDLANFSGNNQEIPVTEKALEEQLTETNGHDPEKDIVLSKNFYIADVDSNIKQEELTYPSSLSIINQNYSVSSLVNETEESNNLSLYESTVVSSNDVQQTVEQDLLAPLIIDEISRSPQQDESPEVIAEAYLSVGNHYRDRIEEGDVTPSNLIEALKAYEQALIWLEKQASPIVPEVINDIANLYWMLSRFPDITLETGEPAFLDFLQRSIESYQLALSKISGDNSHTYAMILNNLGAAYNDLARYQDTADNLQLSIEAYQTALRYRPAKDDPLKYASTQNNLGTAYWHLAQQVDQQLSVQMLQQAIASYSEALNYYNPKEEPLNWAMIQNNLGTTYWNLAQYEQSTTFLELAIKAYHQALKYRRSDLAPAACAATQNNLGTAYWHIAKHYQDTPEVWMQYIEKCIVAYQIAIALAQQLANSSQSAQLTFDVFGTQNNLGLAHYQLATAQKLSLSEQAKSTHLQAALTQHLQALQGLSKQPEPRTNTLNYVIKTIKAFYQQLGLQGQNLALSKVPGYLLPEILPKL
jgi:tetratricopeptide (TPR) repeat protein